MTHQQLFDLQEQIDARLDASNSNADTRYWMDMRVVACKWLDKSGQRGFNGLTDVELFELPELLGALN